MRKAERNMGIEANKPYMKHINHQLKLKGLRIVIMGL